MNDISAWLAAVAAVPQVLQLGPVVLPVSLLFMFAAIFAAGYVGRKFGGNRDEMESALWRALLVGLIAARAAFVLQYSASYFAVPLSIFDIRDGGWQPLAGFIAAWLFVAWRQFRQRALRRPLVGAALAATLIWGGGLLVLSLPAANQQRLPSIALVSLEGAPKDLAEFRGKPVVVNLWATWCPPCVREMPVLHRAQAAHPEVHFVFINQGETAQRVRPWLAARGLPLKNVLLDAKGEALTAFGQRGLPTTLFFDAQGRLAGARTGELSEATLQEKLASIAGR